MSRVFISYVREDKAVAERLYQDLKVLGADPWLDVHDLVAGQGWRGAIKQAVRRSSHFIAVISQNSIRKRGYAQGEMREALEMLKEIPPDEIYVIPVRLDDTVPPYEELQELQYADLFPSYSEGLQEIRKALDASGGMDSDTINASLTHSRDAVRIRSYRDLFDRPAFQLPCIFEFALLEVQAAIQDISAAMATGRVYSRDGRLLMEVPPKSAFETEPYESTLNEIRNSLSGLRRTVASLSTLLCNAAGVTVTDFEKTFDHMEFFLADLSENVSRQFVVEAFALMDRVDCDRNAILKKLNALLTSSQSKTLPYITVSSDQLKRSAELEENEGGGTQRWDDFYLRLHRRFSQLLESGDP